MYTVIHDSDGSFEEVWPGNLLTVMVAASAPDAELVIDKALAALEQNPITGQEMAYTVLRVYQQQRAAIAGAEMKDSKGE